MANVDNLTKIFRARFLESFYQTNIWPGLMENVSAEIPAGSNALDMPYDTTNYAVKEGDFNAQVGPASQTQDQARTALERGDPTVVSTAKRTLTMDQIAEIDYLIGEVAEMNIRPSQIDSAARHTARVVAEKMNLEIREAYDAATEGTLTVVTTAAGDFGNAAHRTGLVGQFREAQKRANINHWPRDGRTVVMSPVAYDLFVEDLIEKKLLLVQGATDVAVREGELVRYRGWDVTVDDSMPSSEAANSLSMYTYWFRRGEGLAYADRLIGVRTIASEKYRGDRLVGQMQYGLLINQPGKLMIGKNTITA